MTADKARKIARTIDVNDDQMNNTLDANTVA